MADVQWSSPPREGENGNWKSPVRKVAWQMRRDGISLGNIVKKTGIPKSTLRGILCQDTCHRTCKGKKYQASLLTVHDICQAIRLATKGYTGRRLTWEQLAAILPTAASSHTI